MADFQDEKLIPMIHVIRKLSARGLDDQYKLLQQLLGIFQSHRKLSVLKDIICVGLCRPDFYQSIPSTLYRDIEDILPPDDQLDIKDSVFESRLVEAARDEDELDEDEISTNQKKEKLPLTLLRIPTDLQFHLFHFLDVWELMNVQRVCRALCIVARNPLSLYSLTMNPKCPNNHHFVEEWFSRPKVLDIHFNYGLEAKGGFDGSTNALCANTKWSQSVTHLSIASTDSDFMPTLIPTAEIHKLAPFNNLTYCYLRGAPTATLLQDEKIASYHTLRELRIYGMTLNKKILDEVFAFSNLEVLSLQRIEIEDENEAFLFEFPMDKLREFTFDAETWLNLHIWADSMPEILNVVNLRYQSKRSILSENSPEAMAAIRAVKCLNIKNTQWSPNIMIFIKTYSALIRKAYDVRSQKHCLEKSNIHLSLSYLNLSPIVELFQFVQQSKLKLKGCGDAVYEDVIKITEVICSAPYATFSNFEMEAAFDIEIGEDFWNTTYESKLIETMKVHDAAAKNLVKDEVSRVLNEVDKWFSAWLVLEERMMQIGLQSLDLRLKCLLRKPSDDAYDDVDDELRKVSNIGIFLERHLDTWIAEGAKKWIEKQFGENTEIIGCIDNDFYTLRVSARA